MAIEMNQPGVEALIQRQIQTGAFASIEEFLSQAVKAIPRRRFIAGLA